MIISVDASSATPPFEQVRVQLISMINSGDLLPGTRLPTVRALAADLHLAPNTVARAYKELEETSFLHTRGRAGTFVAAGSDTTRTRAMEAAHAYAHSIQSLNVSTADAIDFVIAAFATTLAAQQPSTSELDSTVATS